MTEFEIERIVGRTGLETIKINGYFLHSKYDPIREAREFAKKHYTAGNTHILFGYGNGYIAEALKNEFTSNEKLICIEPILKSTVIEKRDVIAIEENKIEEMEMSLTQYISIFNNVNIICSPNYDKICPTLFKETLALLKNKLSINRVNENTINAMAHEWQRNYLYNIKSAVRDQSIEVLYKFSNAPVVIASGGPSLTKQLPLVKKIRDYIILIASGSTVNTLLKANIEPDYVVSIDSQEANYNHFKDAKLTNARFIYSMYSHYKIREKFTNEAYYFLSKGDPNLLEHFKSVVHDNVIVLDGGGSVANFAFSIANYITSGPIALIGQDLAYTNRQSHAINNKHFKIISDEEINQKSMFMTTGYYNDEVLTDYALFSMKKSFEQLLNKFQINQKVFNCTEGGIKLDNFIQIPFSHFVEEFVTINSVELVESKNIKHLSNRVIINKFITELKNYEKIIVLVNENLRLLAANKSKVQFSSSILKKLDRNDELIEKYRNDTALQIIMDPINIKIFKDFKPKNIETATEKYKRVFEQSKMLYIGYLEAIKLTKQYTVELCELLELEKGKYE